jgi:hypothetical protein
MKRMTSVCLRVVAVMSIALFAPLWATPAQADNLRNTFNGGVGGWVACMEASVSLTGAIDIGVQTNTEPDQPMVSVHMNWQAQGSATNGADYRMSQSAFAKFDAVAATYDVPYHSVFIGKGKATNFTMDGIIKVYVDAAGFPTGAWIQSGSLNCQGPE